MKLYLAMSTHVTLMEGSFENILGVFSTPEKAAEELKKEHGFSDADKVADFRWKLVFDGELTEYWEVIPVMLDEGLHDY